MGNVILLRVKVVDFAEGQHRQDRTGQLIFGESCPNGRHEGMAGRLVMTRGGTLQTAAAWRTEVISSRWLTRRELAGRHCSRALAATRVASGHLPLTVEVLDCASPPVP